MGHQIRYYTCKDNDKSRKLIEKKANEDAIYDGDYHHELNNNIRWLDSPIQEDKDKAYEFIKKHDRLSYDQLAVRYYDYGNPKPSKTLDKIRVQYEDAIHSRDDLAYKLNHDFHSCKSQYVGCTECGSKLKRDLIKGHHCPLCNKELLSDTALKRIKAANDKVINYKEKLLSKEKEIKKKNKSEVRWLVKTEYHV